jgi:hypothetical protein
MKMKVSALIIALFWVLALADHPADQRSIRFYAEDLLEARQQADGTHFTSVRILKERLAGLMPPPQNGTVPPSCPVNTWDHRVRTRRQDSSPSDERWKGDGAADIPDMMINQEGYASSFNQRDPCICMFPDRSFVTVWQDERNGDLDVFAQKCSFSGSPQGFNFEVGEEEFPKDQFLPCVSVMDDTSFVVVWVDEQGFEIYGKEYRKDLSPAGSAFQVEDSPIPFTTWLPAVSCGPDGEFVVVWADTRSGSNIYARRFDPSGVPLGAGFKVNQDDGSRLHASPGVAVGLSGNFVVVWEDYRNLNGDIYAQRFDAAGASLGENVLVNLDSLAEDQYNPCVSVGLNDRFMIAWVDLRYGDRAILARILSFADPPGDTTLFSVSSGSAAQDGPPIVADTLGRFTVAWTEYAASDPTVYARRFDSLGQALGGKMIISSSHAAGERHGACISSAPDGSFSVAWMDKRAGNYDIYAQAVTSNGFLNGTNLLVNDDELGANQDHPQIAIRSDGGFAVAWEDFRREGSDIFMRRFDQSANPLSDDRMVNDSLGRFYHGKPDLACDDSGNLLVVWEDTRGGLLELYAQMFDHSGNPTGGNFRVNCQGMINNSSPCCDISPAGDLVVVWSASEETCSHVFGRLLTYSGKPADTCFMVNDDGLSVEHLNPRVAMDGSGAFVVVWQDRREGQDRIYAQRFAPDGSRRGGNFPTYCDRADPAQYDPDLDLNQRGDLVITWVEPFLSPTMIFAQMYDSSGAPVDTNLAVVDDPLAFPEKPKVALTDDGHFIVAWTDGRSSVSDIYFQAFLNGSRLGSNRMVNGESQALQDIVDITTGGSFLYSVWRDNRVPGLGFSIFFNTVDFTETAVEDEQDEEGSPPRGFRLAQNYPNPFNPVTTIRYAVGGKQGRPVPVTLKIYNVLGQWVRTLVDEEKGAGTHLACWDGRDESGRQVSSGIYLYRLEIGDHRVTKKMLLLR